MWKWEQIGPEFAHRKKECDFMEDVVVKKSSRYLYSILIIAALLISPGFTAFVSAAQIYWENPWSWGLVNKSAVVSFEHNNRDVWDYGRDQTGITMGGEAANQPAQMYSSFNQQGAMLSETGNFGTAGVNEPVADASALVNPTPATATVDQSQFSINNQVSGESFYNTITSPEGRDNPIPTPDPSSDYYANWEYHTANSFAYGGYTNGFQVIGDDVANTGETVLVSATYTFGYDLMGTWSYGDDNGYDELQGFSWNAFSSYLDIREDGSSSSFFNLLFTDELNRSGNYSSPSSSSPVIEKIGDDYTYSFSFWAAEGITYWFSMWANLGGHADGIANYDSSGYANLNLQVNPVPEPRASILWGIGLLGLGLWGNRHFRSRWKKQKPPAGSKDLGDASMPHTTFVRDD